MNISFKKKPPKHSDKNFKTENILGSRLHFFLHKIKQVLSNQTIPLMKQKCFKCQANCHINVKC